MFVHLNMAICLLHGMPAQQKHLCAWKSEQGIRRLQVVFHPNTETVLATGATDGLVNIIDLKVGARSLRPW